MLVFDTNNRDIMGISWGYHGDMRIFFWPPRISYHKFWWYFAENLHGCISFPPSKLLNVEMENSHGKNQENHDLHSRCVFRIYCMYLYVSLESDMKYRQNINLISYWIGSVQQPNFIHFPQEQHEPFPQYHNLICLYIYITNRKSATLSDVCTHSILVEQ